MVSRRTLLTTLEHLECGRTVTAQLEDDGS